MKKFTSIIVSFFVFALTVPAYPAVAAGTASLSFGTASITKARGETFTTDIVLNNVSGDEATGAVIEILYNTAYLESPSYTVVTPVGGSCSLNFGSSPGPGRYIINIACGPEEAVIWPVGTSTIARVSLKTKATGVTSISFGSESRIVNTSGEDHTLSTGANPTSTITITSPPPVYQKVHRFWNIRGTHFYTASEAEKNTVMTKWPTSYRYEGVAYNINTNSEKTMTPLYRLWNSKGTHFYTASYAEATNAVTRWPKTFRLEGIAYYVTKDSNNTTPVYRFYNLKNGTHFYTASEAEKTNVITKLSRSYRYEGVAYYIPR